MCPACLANMALFAVGATSAGGVAALVVKKLSARKGAKDINPKTQTKGEQNENQTRERRENDDSPHNRNT